MNTVHDLPPILAIDPGETFGVAVMLPPDLGISCTEMNWTHGLDLTRMWLSRYPGSVLVVEKYQLYSQSAGAQTGSTLHTPRMIGRLEEIAYARGRNIHMVPASMKPAGRRMMVDLGQPEPLTSKPHASDAFDLAGAYVREVLYR